MPQPTAYTRKYDFANYQTSNPTDPVPADRLETEFNAVKQTTDEALANLALIQRDDGKLKNSTVHADSLSAAVRALTLTEMNPRGNWATSTSYAVKDVVEQGSTGYICMASHTSGVFDDDHAAGRWLSLGTAEADVSDYRALATGSALARTLAARFSEVVNLRDEGATGNGSTDDHAAASKARARLISAGGGKLLVPPSADGYVFGDRSTDDTGFVLPSNTHLQGFGAAGKIIHRAKNPDGQFRLIRIMDVENVEVTDLEIDAESEVAVGVELAGVIRNVALRRIRDWNGLNFSAQFAAPSVDPEEVAYDGLLLEDVESLGLQGETGAGGGFIFFPRTQITTERPASKNLYLNRVYADVSNDTTNISDHAAQGYKIQNVEGVYGGLIRSRGGNVAGTNVSTGARDVFIDTIIAELTKTALQLTADARYCTTRARNIHVGRVWYDSDGKTGPTTTQIVDINGAIPNLTLGELLGDGDVLISATNNKRWRLTSQSGEFITRGVTGEDAEPETPGHQDDPVYAIGQTSGAELRVEGWAASDPNVIQFTVISGTPQQGEEIVQAAGALRADGTPTTVEARATLDSEIDLNLFRGAIIGWVQATNGRITTDAAGQTPPSLNGWSIGPMILNGGTTPLGSFDMDPGFPFTDSAFGPLIATRHRGNAALQARGSARNRFSQVVSINGNPDGAVATSMVVLMQGSHDYYPEISIATHQGTHDIDNWFRCTGGGGGNYIGLLRGTPSGGATHRGMDILNMEAADPLRGDFTREAGPFDLSGAAEEVLIPIDRNARVLSIVLTFPEATSADAGVALEVGVVGANTRFLNETTPTEQSDRLVYQNTAGTRSFSSRHIVAGEVLRIAHAGGKAGDGMVGVVVNMVTVLSQ